MHACASVGWRPNTNYSEDDQAPDVKLRKNTAKKERVGNGAVRRLHQRQLAHLEEDASTKFDDVPTLIGEVGVPFDLDDRALYALPPKTPDYAEIYVPTIDGDRLCGNQPVPSGARRWRPG